MDLYAINVASDFWIYQFSAGVEKKFNSNEFALGSSLDLIYHDPSDSSIYYDTIFATASLGLNIWAKYLYRKYNFYLMYQKRFITEATFTDAEDTVTKIDHDFLNVLKLGLNTCLKSFLLSAELANFNFGDTKILSKDFSYQIDSTNLQRISLGMGHQFERFTLWLRWFRFGDPSDQISHIYQAPFFAPDYTLAKESIQAEIIWHF